MWEKIYGQGCDPYIPPPIPDVLLAQNDIDVRKPSDRACTAARDDGQYQNSNFRSEPKAPANGTSSLSLIPSTVTVPNKRKTDTSPPSGPVLVEPQLFYPSDLGLLLDGMDWWSMIEAVPAAAQRMKAQILAAAPLRDAKARCDIQEAIDSKETLEAEEARAVQEAVEALKAKEAQNAKKAQEAQERKDVEKFLGHNRTCNKELIKLGKGKFLEPEVPLEKAARDQMALEAAKEEERYWAAVEPDSVSHETSFGRSGKRSLPTTEPEWIWHETGFMSQEKMAEADKQGCAFVQSHNYRYVYKVAGMTELDAARYNYFRQYMAWQAFNGYVRQGKAMRLKEGEKAPVWKTSSNWRLRS